MGEVGRLVPANIVLSEGLTEIIGTPKPLKGVLFPGVKEDHVLVDLVHLEIIEVITGPGGFWGVSDPKIADKYKLPELSVAIYLWPPIPPPL